MDIEQAAATSGLERCDLELIAAAFERVAIEAMGHLDAAIKADDQPLAQKALHKLAGSSAALLGQPDVNAIAKANEEQIKAGATVDLEAARGRLSELLVIMGVRL
jgi:hypothetical protein